MPNCFVAVHAGAGYHAAHKEAAYKKAMRAAVIAAQNALSNHSSALDAVAAAISVLEDAAVTNAGTGSNLTRDGTVECDASIMAGDGLFGAVGAAPGLRNPIQAAAMLALHSQQPLPLGLIPPRLLVGEGARRWAQQEGLATVDDMGLVTPEAHQAWQQYSALLQAAEQQQQPQQRQGVEPEQQQVPPEQVQVAPPQPQQQQQQLRQGGRQPQQQAAGRLGGSAQYTSAVVPPSGQVAAPAQPSAASTASKAAPGAGSKRPAAVMLHGSSKRPGHTPAQAATVAPTCAVSAATAAAAVAAAEQSTAPPQSQQDGDAPTRALSAGPPAAAAPAPAASPSAAAAAGAGSPSRGAPTTSQPLPLAAAAGRLPPDLLLDTVGCVVVDSSGWLAAGVSSGGLAMKYPGRVGEAALFGAGCWAQDPRSPAADAAAARENHAGPPLGQPTGSFPCSTAPSCSGAAPGVPAEHVGCQQQLDGQPGCQQQLGGQAQPQQQIHGSSSSGGCPGLAVSTSGVGEHIMLCQLAQRCAVAAAAAAAAAGDGEHTCCQERGYVAEAHTRSSSSSSSGSGSSWKLGDQDGQQQNSSSDGPCSQEDLQHHGADSAAGGGASSLQRNPSRGADGYGGSGRQGGSSVAQLAAPQGAEASADISLAAQWESVLQCHILQGPPPHDCGVVGVRVSREAGGAVVVEFAAVQSASSFGVAYSGPGLAGVQCHIMRQQQPAFGGGSDGGRRGVQHMEAMCKWPQVP